jgi:hypothetical protein
VIIRFWLVFDFEEKAWGGSQAFYVSSNTLCKFDANATSNKLITNCYEGEF